MRGCRRFQLEPCRIDACATVVAPADAQAQSDTKEVLKKRLIALLPCRSLSLITDQTENAVSTSSHLTLVSMVKQVVFHFPEIPVFLHPLILAPASVLTHCHLHTSWCVTFCRGSCVCFTPMPLLVQTALAQKAAKLHVLSPGSIFHPCVESRPECCHSCSAISATKTASCIHVVNAHTCTRECPYK